MVATLTSDLRMLGTSFICLVMILGDGTSFLILGDGDEAVLTTDLGGIVVITVGEVTSVLMTVET